MNKPLKIIKVGNSAGVILPKEILAKLRVSLGEDLYVTETANGGYELQGKDPEFEAQMLIARDVMAKRKRALRELAK